jgi:hypothetical protein
MILPILALTNVLPVHAQTCWTTNSCWTITNESRHPITVTCTNPIDEYFVSHLQPGQHVQQQYDPSYGDGLGLWPVTGVCSVRVIDSDREVHTAFETKHWGSTLFATYTQDNRLEINLQNYWQ